GDRDGGAGRRHQPDHSRPPDPAGGDHGGGEGKPGRSDPYSEPVKHEANVIDLGTRAYADVWAMQLALVKQRQQGEIPDTLLFVEHPHVITAGRSAKRDNLLELGDTPLFEIERGGDVTYHGPGQLVGYPIFLLRADERDLHLYLRNLEESLIRTVGRFDIPGERKDGWTGVWTTGGVRKLASIGVAVKRWVT